MDKCYIIHVDMDAFYAAVEQRDNPELRGKPVIIGGNNPQSRGVVSTCSYEARKYGIHSAMPLQQAYRRCPEGIYLAGNMGKYEEVSRKIRKIFRRYTPMVEPLSLDEAFLDVRGCEKLFGSPVEIGLKIKDAIKDELDLVASVGVAPNKFLAKLSSDLDKPDGFVVITSNQIEEKVWPLPIKRLWGVGKKTEEFLLSRGIKTIGMLAKLEPTALKSSLGKLGLDLYKLAHGQDYRKVEPSSQVKSVGNEITFKEDTSSPEFLETTLLELAEQVGRRLRKSNILGRTVSIKLRYSNFKTITRSKTLTRSTNSTQILYEVGIELLRKTGLYNKSFRLLGLSVSKLIKEEQQQLSLFEENDSLRSDTLTKIMDDLKDKFGEDAVTRARLISNKSKKKWLKKRNERKNS
ncbi:MAG: DNA polymerase IV [Candidatus Aenigmarchaeota archaeon]|nr:DNA polymerase IV [Candidatus Aenigmarchaeota archaeon]